MANGMTSPDFGPCFRFLMEWKDHADFIAVHPGSVFVEGSAGH